MYYWLHRKIPCIQDVTEYAGCTMPRSCPGCTMHLSCRKVGNRLREPMKYMKVTTNYYCRTRRLLGLLLLLFAFCNEVVTQPTNIGPATTDSGLRVSLDPAATSILVTWHLQDTDTDVYEYEVTLRENGFTHKITYVKDMRTTFYDLDPCVTYSVKVQPFDRDGRNIGRPATEQATTDASAPPSARHLSATSSTASSLTLTWERPDTACQVAAYTITYAGVAQWGTRAEHTGSSAINADDKGAIQTTISGLMPYADYTIVVTASNNMGQGQTATIVERTEQDVPSQPTNLNVLQITSHSVTMVWKEPKEQKGVVEKYNVFVFARDQMIRWEVTDHPVHIIDQLSPCTSYTVRVAGITGGGRGPDTEAQVTTDAGELWLPRDPECKQNSDNTVLVTWVKPQSACPITGFKVSHLDTPTTTEDVQASKLSYKFSPGAGLPRLACVAAATSDTVIGPRACCKPIVTAAPAAPTTPQAQTNRDGNGNGSEQASSGPFLLWVVVGVAVAVTVWQ